MTRYDRRVWVLAACLSAVAGFVDAIGFITLGGYFVSFMSGNSTRMAVGLADGSATSIVPAALIAAFVLGVVVGSLIGNASGHRRRSAVLALVAALLALAALSSALGLERVAVGLMALAMGAENAAFEREGEVSIGLTYMTGTLVKLGQRLTGMLLGRDPWAWIPYLLLWLGLVAGAVAGAFSYAAVGLQALWMPAAASAALSYAAHLIGSGERQAQAT